MNSSNESLELALKFLVRNADMPLAYRRPMTDMIGAIGTGELSEMATGRNFPRDVVGLLGTIGYLDRMTTETRIAHLERMAELGPEWARIASKWDELSVLVRAASAPDASKHVAVALNNTFADLISGEQMCA